jgi:hypothetical protein
MVAVAGAGAKTGAASTETGCARVAVVVAGNKVTVGVADAVAVAVAAGVANGAKTTSLVQPTNRATTRMIKVLVFIFNVLNFNIGWSGPEFNSAYVDARTVKRRHTVLLGQAAEGAGPKLL